MIFSGWHSHAVDVALDCWHVCIWTRGAYVFFLIRQPVVWSGRDDPQLGTPLDVITVFFCESRHWYPRKRTPRHFLNNTYLTSEIYRNGQWTAISNVLDSFRRLRQSNCYELRLAALHSEHCKQRATADGFNRDWAYTHSPWMRKRATLLAERP